MLESLAPPAEAGGLLDRLDVPEDLTPALAAALGDDLLAGTDDRHRAILVAAAAELRRRSCPWA